MEILHAWILHDIHCIPQILQVNNEDEHEENISVNNIRIQYMLLRMIINNI